MCCPYCGQDTSRVIDSRTVEDGIRRRRECASCAARFTTYERVELAPLLIVKRDGRRETFSREKLLAGIRVACEKRPLPAGAVDAVAVEVEREAHGRGVAELPSTLLGELVMERLRGLDQIAYVRFASVYRDFADLDSLRAVLDELDDTRRLAAEPAPPGDPPRRGRRVQRWRGRRARDVIPDDRPASPPDPAIP